MNTNIVTLGGVTVGLSLLAWTLVRWWGQGKGRTFKTLIPYILCTVYGILLILTAGGLLGGLAGYTLWGSSAIGDAALEYGVGGGTPEVTRSSSLILSDGGHAFVIIGTVGLAAWWSIRRNFHKDMAFGIVTGISLGLSDGIAGWAGRILSPVVNWIGDALTGLL